MLTADGSPRCAASSQSWKPCEVENIGHAPMLDEPEAWDAVLEFLGAGGVS